ncbi:MAG: MarR family winged helix-turn-helix transcriptional regulator [Nocardioidaceae bacterium]
MTAGLRPTEPLDYVQNDDETTWLQPLEEQAWQGFLSLNRVVFAELEAQLQSGSRMPLAHYAILVTLSDAPDRTLRMGELARALYAAPSSISHAMTRLESKGLIERRNDPKDRRAQFAVLTDAGAEALAAAAPGHVGAVRRNLIDLLTADQLAQLKEISDAVVNKVRPPR